MHYHQSTYHSRIYRDFKEIAVKDYQQIIRFYEEREEKIRQLDFAEMFEMLLAYVNALFEVGAYIKHLLLVDVIIEASIRENIEIYLGEDIYRQSLFRKAASLFNLQEYDKADYILRELIRINPQDKEVSFFLKKCLCKRHPQLVENSRAVSMVFILLTVFVIGLEVLFVRPFFPSYAHIIEVCRNGVFMLGVVIYFGAGFIRRISVSREVDNYVQQITRKN